MLRQLLAAEAAVEGNVETTSLLRYHGKRLRHHTKLSYDLSDRFDNDIQQIRHRLIGHRREIKRQLRYGEHVRTLVNELLETFSVNLQMS